MCAQQILCIGGSGSQTTLIGGVLSNANQSLGSVNSAHDGVGTIHAVHDVGVDVAVDLVLAVSVGGNIAALSNTLGDPVLSGLNGVHTGDLVSGVDAAGDLISGGLSTQHGNGDTGIDSLLDHILEHLNAHGGDHQSTDVAGSDGVLNESDLVGGVALGILLHVGEALGLHDGTHGVVDPDQALSSGGGQDGPDFLLAVPDETLGNGGAIIGSTVIGRSLLAAGDQAENHSQSKNQSKKLFHIHFLLFSIVSQRMLIKPRLMGT